MNFLRIAFQFWLRSLGCPGAVRGGYGGDGDDDDFGTLQV